MFTTPHAKQRFYERVNCEGLPRKTRGRNKYIENYLKDAYRYGLTPDEIDDNYLRDYMYSKMKQNEHFVTVTKITHYKNNLFLFHNGNCITILDVPKKASDNINNAIYVFKLHPFINCLKEKLEVKKWLRDNGKSIEKTSDLKKIICAYPTAMNYKYILDKFPLNAIKYVKNDSHLKKVIVKTHKKRNIDIKNTYYFLWALLLIIPKNQIINLQNVLKNNKKSFFNIINNKTISKKQIDTCYKQLCILLGDIVVPYYSTFNIDNNECFDIINDHFTNILHNYIIEVKKLFKEIT